MFQDGPTICVAITSNSLDKPAMEFIVSCANARKVGAIGIFYHIQDRFNCETKEEAEKLFYEKYECNSKVMVFQ